MRKGIIVLTSILFINLLCLMSGPLMVSATTTETSADIFVNFDDYDETKISLGDSQTKFGEDKWEVNFCNESSEAEVLTDPTGAGMGKVLRLDNSPTETRSAGSFMHVTYDEENYSARNFTISYDFYSSKGIDSSWSGLYVRSNDASLNYMAMKTVVLFFQKGKGTSSDKVNLSDGSTRPANTEDIYLQYQPSYSYGSGLSLMRDESGKTKEHGRFFATDGGNIDGKWLSAQFKVRGNYFYAAIKERGADNWTELDTGYLNDYAGKITLGSISLGVCGGEYYFDNINIINEDLIPLSVQSLCSAEYGSAYSIQESVGTNTDIALIMEPKNSFTWGKWYKDSLKTVEVNPTGFELQERVLNDQGYYEWKKVDGVVINSFDDYDNIVTESPESLTVKEYYSGENYRIIVYTDSSNGTTYYGEILKRAYSLEIYTEGGGQFGVESLELSDYYLQKHNVGDILRLRAYAEDGKVFAGWYKIVKNIKGDYRIKLTENDEYEYTTEDGGNIILALFVDNGLNKYNVNITTKLQDGGTSDYGTILAGNGSFYEGEEVSLIAEENEGFSFVCYMIGDQIISQNPCYNIIIEEDMEIIAVFEVEKFRIYISDGLGIEKVKIVKANALVNLKAPIAPVGYEFSSWIIEGVEEYYQDQLNRSVSFEATSNKITAKAVYIPKTYKVNLISSNIEQGMVLGTGQYRYGDKVVITVRANDGYSVSNLTVRGAEITFEDDGTYSFIMPDNTVIVNVSFTSIDNIDINKELVAYIIFAVIIVIITVAFLFVRKKSD